MKESQRQKKIVDYLEGAGAYVVKVIKANKAGVPDLICSYCGKFYAFEVKTETGRTSKLQEYHLAKVNDAGGVGAIVRSVEDIKKYI